MLSVLNFLTKKGGNKIDANISKLKSVTQKCLGQLQIQGWVRMQVLSLALLLKLCMLCLIKEQPK